MRFEELSLKRNVRKDIQNRDLESLKAKVKPFLSKSEEAVTIWGEVLQTVAECGWADGVKEILKLKWTKKNEFCVRGILKNLKGLYIDKNVLNLLSEEALDSAATDHIKQNIFKALLTSGEPEIARWFFDKYDRNVFFSADSHGYDNYLVSAVASGDLATIEMLGSLLPITKDDLKTHIFNVVKDNDIEMLDYMRSKGVSIKEPPAAQDFVQGTLLGFAVYYEAVDSVLWLLEKEEWSARELYDAASKWSGGAFISNDKLFIFEEIVRRLISMGMKDFCQELMNDVCAAELIIVLINAGCDPNDSSESLPPLLRCIKNSDPSKELIFKLVNLGCDPSVETSDKEKIEDLVVSPLNEELKALRESYEMEKSSLTGNVRKKKKI